MLASVASVGGCPLIRCVVCYLVCAHSYILQSSVYPLPKLPSALNV